MAVPPSFTLFPGNTTSAAGVDNLNSAAVPFTLGDVPLDVSTTNQLYTADPYTGGVETQVSSTGLPDSTIASYGDLAMRNDGNLYGVLEDTATNALTGTFEDLDTGEASDAPVTNQWDGITTYQQVGTSLQAAGTGMNLNALAYGPGNLARTLYGVGDDSLYNPDGDNGEVGVPSTNSTAFPYAGGYPDTYGMQNLMYEFNEDGQAVDPVGVDPQGSPATSRVPTNIIPLAQLLSGPTIMAPSYGASNPVNSSDGSDNDILDGNQFTITAANGKAMTFEMDSGPDMDLGTYGSEGVRNGQEFSLTEDLGGNLITKTFEFDSGPVLIFHNGSGSGLNGGDNLNGATFTVTDDTGLTHQFEFVEPTTPTTNASSGYTAINIPVNSNAQVVANAAVTAISGAGDLQAALGEWGDAADNPDPTSGSTWARVSLIQDDMSDTPTGDGNLVQVQGNYTVPTGVIPIYYKETYSAKNFLAIETATPTAPESATDMALAFPWAGSFAQQIATVVNDNMSGIKAGYSTRDGAQGVDARVNFYGAIAADFGQATALVHYAGVANADFDLTAVNGGTKYNGVQVEVVQGGIVGNNAAVTFTPGGSSGGTLIIDVSPTTTALTVVNQINSEAATGTIPFTASLNASLETGGLNTGLGIVQAIAAGQVTTGGGIANGVITWTDTSGDTPQVESGVPSATNWGQVWTWRLGANNTDGPYAPYSAAGLQSSGTNNYLVPFGAGDSPNTIAQEIANAVNSANAAGLFPVTATADGGEVALSDAEGPPVVIASATEAGTTATITTLLPHGFFVGEEMLVIAGVGGAGGSLAIASATETGNTVTITTDEPTEFVVGEQVIVSGVGVNGYNGTFTVTAVTGTTFSYADLASGLAPSTGGTAEPAGLSYDGTFTVTAVPNATTFTYTLSTGGLSPSSGGTAEPEGGSPLPQPMVR